MKRRRTDYEYKELFQYQRGLFASMYITSLGNGVDVFDPRLLEPICVIREKLGKPITVNTWHSGGGLTQRGLRCNVSN